MAPAEGFKSIISFLCGIKGLFGFHRLNGELFCALNIELFIIVKTPCHRTELNGKYCDFLFF